MRVEKIKQSKHKMFLKQQKTYIYFVYLNSHTRETEFIYPINMNK